MNYMQKSLKREVVIISSIFGYIFHYFSYNILHCTLCFTEFSIKVPLRVIILIIELHFECSFPSLENYVYKILPNFFLIFLNVLIALFYLI